MKQTFKSKVTRFLKELGIYIAYIQNYDINFAIPHKENVFDFIDEVEKTEVINYAFNWQNTAQGHGFWYAVDILWKDYYRKSINLTEAVGLFKIKKKEWQT